MVYGPAKMGDELGFINPANPREGKEKVDGRPLAAVLRCEDLSFTGTLTAAPATGCLLRSLQVDITCMLT